MEFTASQIAHLLNGKVEGSPEVIVHTLSKIEEGKPGSISFLSNPNYTHYLYNTDASVVIVNNDFIAEHPIKNSCTLIRVDDARAAFAKLLELYKDTNNNKTGIEQPSFISKSATLGKNVYIGTFTYISDNVKIGNNVKLFPNTFVGANSVIDDGTIVYAGVKIYSNTRIGKNCILHSGVVLGSDGFGFTQDTHNKKITHIGNVVIEDNVEIGANTTIDRATLGSTIIRKGVKLDNLIQIAHNVEIGENTVIAAQTGISGSAKIGKNCMIGGQVGIVGHITIADGVKIAAQSGIGNSITQEGAVVQGSPAFTIGEYKRSYVLFKNFPSIDDRIKSLEKLIEEKMPIIDKRPEIEYIKKIVCDYFGVNIEYMKANKRTQDIARARQIAIYLSRILTKDSLNNIGKHFGRDHATILYTCKQIKKLRRKDANFNGKIRYLINKIKNA